MASTPAITVLVPVHNNAAGVRRTLEALAELVGEHEQLEVIVVDDGSTDDTPSVLPDAVRPFRRHQIITTSNQGAAIARNVAASVATGEFLVFLDANDEPLDGWVAGLARQLEPGVGIAHCEPGFLRPGHSNRPRIPPPGLLHRLPRAVLVPRRVRPAASFRGELRPRRTGPRVLCGQWPQGLLHRRGPPRGARGQRPTPLRRRPSPRDELPARPGRHRAPS